MSLRKTKFFRILIALDQLFAVIFLNCNPDQTISGWVGYRSMHTPARRWTVAEKFINFLFSYWEKDHCRNSIEYDRLDR